MPAGTPIIQVFDNLGSALLILGAPGTGKTTLLLELAQELLERAEQDQSPPCL
jgi:predicted NACHT family NTPase